MNKTLDISIIIPSFNTKNSIKVLISLFLNQKFLPKEIIIIDSGSNLEIEKYLYNLSKVNKTLIYKKVSKAYPGTARNIGIKLANSKYIAFFDVNTFPDNFWLEKSYNFINNSSLNYLIGTRITLSNSYLKTINKFSTYGKNAYIAVTGTIILKKYLLKKNLFFLNTRAGEDIEWIIRLTNKQNYKINKNNIFYNGLSGNIFFNLKKWFTYSLAYSKIQKDLNNQKKIYFSAILYMLIFFLFLNINEFLIFLSFNLLIYSIFFSIIRPIRSGVLLKELLPFNWLLVFVWRFSFDISKAPGLILGFFNLFLKK